MRITYLLLLISLVCLVSAKYLPDESTSRALQRNKRSLTDETDNTVEDQSNESDDDDDDDNEDNDSSEQKQQKEIKCAEQQRKLQAKREKEERKRVEKLEKEQRKREKLEAKIKEEERKLQEKLEKEQRKREEKLAKEELKRAEKIAKEERKRQEKMRKQIEKLEKKTLGSVNKSAGSSESEEDLDFEDIWKNYIYQKYDLTESSTDLEKDAAVNRYIQEELSLNANSSKNEYRQAVLQLVNKNLSGANSSSGFQNYFVSHVNAVYIQKLQADIENKIAELDNDTALLQNVSLPWAPEAKHAIGEEKSILTSIAQFLSDVVPTWITGGKPASDTSISSSPTSDTSTSTISNTGSSNAGLLPNSNEGSVSTSESNNVGLVDGTVVVIDSVNADGASSVVNTVPSDDGASVNSNINASTSSSNVELNGNSFIGQSTVSTVDSNGSTVTEITSVSSPAVSDGSITNDILPSNSPAGNSSSGHATSNANGASSVLNTVISNAGSSVNSNIDAPTSSSNVDLNENNLTGQSAGSTLDVNGSSVTGATSVSDPTIPAGTDVKPVEFSNVVEASSVLPSAVGDVSSIDTALTGSSDSQSPGSSISISASPSAESSTSINNLSTGTEASSSSVNSDADANPQVSNNNGSIANSGIQTVVEIGISDNPSAPEVSVNTDNTVSTDAGITSSIDVVTTVASDQTQGAETTETISSNIDLSGTSINEATSTGGQIADSVSFSTDSSVNVVNDATLDTVSVGAEVAVENTEISTDINNPLNIATGPTSVTADGPTAETESTVATSSADAIPVAGSSTVSISAAEDTGLLLEAPDVTVQNNVDKPVDITSNSQVNTAEATDSTNIISTNFSDTTTMDTLSISNGTEESTVNTLPASPGSSANNDVTVVSSGTDESVINTTGVVSAAAEITVTTPTLDPISTSDEPISEVPTTVADVTDTSKLQSSNPAISETVLSGPEVITNETTVVNDATVNKDVSVSPPEEVANTSIPIVTQTSLSENEVPVAVTVVFEPSVDSVLNVAGKLPSSTVNIVPVDEESATVASDNAFTVASITTDSFQLTPAAVETSAAVEPQSTSVISDSVPSTFTDNSANDITVSSSDVTLAPGLETVGTDSGLLSTSDVIVTTEAPLAAQKTNTPTIPEEVGASLLEVTQQ